MALSTGVSEITMKMFDAGHDACEIISKSDVGLMMYDTFSVPTRIVHP